MSKKYVYDYETINNCFVAVFMDFDTEELKIFVAHRYLHDSFKEFIDFLNESKDAQYLHCGFNSISFDGQITEWILRNQKVLLEEEDKARVIYSYAQDVISRSNANEYPDYKETDFSIPNFDIFKMNHWDSPAKHCSLKWTQFSMDWENVEEMSHPHYKDINTRKELFNVINYCINDVRSTRAIFNIVNSKGESVMISQQNLRVELSKEYGINLYSASEPRISKEIFLKFLAEKTGRPESELKKLRTFRKEVPIKPLVLPYVKFNNPEFKQVLNWFNNLRVDTAIKKVKTKTKGPSFEMIHKDVTTVYGLGGLHGCIKQGVYVSTKTHVIKSADVKSYYPNLAIRNRWAPAHLNKSDFVELYEWFYDERGKYSKKDSKNYLYKIVLNSTYGLSKSEHSFLYDPELTFRITVNGQLLLTMLYEMISENIPGAVPLMQNTDGLEFIIPREYEQEYYKICKEWEAMTDLVLEFADYDKMVISDVNNYIAIDSDGVVKCKGKFECEDLPLHKNKSNLIVPKALYEYFVNGIKPEDYLSTNKNIFDYCCGTKLRGSWFFKTVKIDKGTYIENTLKQKLLRTYISKTDNKVKLLKCHPDGREQQVVSGNYHHVLFNKYVKKNFEDYNVDTNYYLSLIRKEISNIETPPVKRKNRVLTKPSQLTMF